MRSLAYGHDAKASSAFSDRQTMGTVLGSGNNPTHQNIEGRPHSQSTQLQKDNHHLPTHQSAHTEKMTPHTTKADGHAKASPTSSDRQTMGIVLGSGNNPTHKNTEGRPDSQSYTEGMAIASDKTKNISDFQKTYHVCSVEPGRQKPEQPTKTGKSEIQPTVKAGKPERQQTDSTTGDIVNAEREVERPISQLLSTRRSKEAETAYQKLLDNQKHLTAAEKQYYQLFKRDENFKRRFPEQHRELQVFMTDPEECAIASYEALYSALRRLSKFASQQLTAGNPNIADLSDKHRPTKIGEFYSELYDNEWSEAFEVIKPLVYPNATEDPDTEYFEEVLRILKNILMAAYEFSAERTEKHLEDIKLTLLGTITDQEKDKAKGTEYDRFVTEHAMKYRKEAAAYAIKMASKAFKRDGLQKFLKQKSEDPKLLAYVDKCVELTWYMRIQDPPMHLHCLQEKETISKAEFAFHGRKGKTTLVCVWPALLLFEGGHLVTKGHVLPEE
uniref:Mitochondria-eating protein C-terminal domain-containing protein n=1 Tax=Magallana gigas TaxID=29159 RepID=K1RFD5_MAGGI